MTVETLDREAVEAAKVEGYVEVDEATAQDIGMLKAARKNERGWKTRKDELTAKVKDVLSGSQGAIYDGRVIAEIKTRNGKRVVDLDLLKAKFPAAYAECVSDGPKQTVLDLR